MGSEHNQLQAGKHLSRPAAIKYHRAQRIGGEGLSCAEETFDFGSVDRAAARSLSHRFLLINGSSQPIRIIEHKPSCGWHRPFCCGGTCA
jgi:hypothetical protein